ncbi:hypothetical protein EDB85DRAFT_2155215 [Lactarius pseudohatsudake]|nr:hypothetical protein EDB85DRAFT_2155215 [Lactarius pseudohatsudake]
MSEANTSASAAAAHDCDSDDLHTWNGLSGVSVQKIKSPETMAMQRFRDLLDKSNWNLWWEHVWHMLDLYVVAIVAINLKIVVAAIVVVVAAVVIVVAAVV